MDVRVEGRDFTGWGTKIVHCCLHLLWRFQHLLLSMWYQALNLMDMLESCFVSSGFLKKYSSMDVNKLKYLAVVIESEDAFEISKILELLQWLDDIGVRHVCLYDKEGVLKKSKELIIEKLSAKLWQVVCASQPFNDQNQRTLEFTSFSDGKEGVAKAANLFFGEYLKSREKQRDGELPKLTEKLMDDTLTIVGCRGPDPDLLLVYGPVRCHLGFPAWRLRYSEIVHMGPLRSSRYGSLLKAIHRFTRVHQNYGT